DDDSVVGRTSLVWGVQAIPIERIASTEAMLGVIRDRVSYAGFSGTVVVTTGIPTMERSRTNTVHVMDV
ncbi:MAG: hypothetical protein PHQ19_08375, partial [Candidatus Krumholzibacteria bacterium]|nr:hypothetical protein [Candidatus Krumholzibacteria bacterium]